MSAVFEFADGRSRSKPPPGRRDKKRQDMFQTEPENGRRYQRAERSERISIWTFASFSLTNPTGSDCVHLASKASLTHSL